MQGLPSWTLCQMSSCAVPCKKLRMQTPLWLLRRRLKVRKLVTRTLVVTSAHATSNRCIASSNKCLTSSNKNLLETSAALVVTGALLVVPSAVRASREQPARVSRHGKTKPTQDASSYNVN